MKYLPTNAELNVVLHWNFRIVLKSTNIGKSIHELSTKHFARLCINNKLKNMNKYLFIPPEMIGDTIGAVKERQIENTMAKKKKRPNKVHKTENCTARRQQKKTRG